MCGTGAVAESIHLETQAQGRENDTRNGLSLLKPQDKTTYLTPLTFTNWQLSIRTHKLIGTTDFNAIIIEVMEIDPQNLMHNRLFAQSLSSSYDI